ncbi:hypothetical protein [Streptomyces sp. SID13031]|uniref:Ig-like domain-containing protein n=1 Tax=Streptomyces sp. SID13031 TaxID=2706046 RepID=UPI0013C8ECAF|nr:hypothetical protein [Streptomyces sp. SID13031]NEA30705.1 hypothetical protein [Streptomyces sp. SID13031]
METQRGRQVGRQLKETNAFSGKSLLLGVFSSLVCSAIIPALGAGRGATLAGAALSPVLVAVITTQGAGLIRGAGVAVLSAVALIVSVGGFTLPEAIAGHGSLTADGPGTFVNTRRGPSPTPATPQPTKSATKSATVRPTPKVTTRPTPSPTTSKSSTSRPGPRLKLEASRRCPEATLGQTVTCHQIGLTNAGTTTIRVTTSDLAGDQAGDFVLTKQCNGTLAPDRSCSVRLKFRPTTVGVRQASFVVKVYPGGIVHDVTLTGTAVDNSEKPSEELTPTPSFEPPLPTATPGEANE